MFAAKHCPVAALQRPSMHLHAICFDYTAVYGVGFRAICSTQPQPASPGSSPTCISGAESAIFTRLVLIDVCSKALPSGSIAAALRAAAVEDRAVP
jgi:hypothetical protein